MRFEKTRTLWELTRGQRLRYGAAIAAMGFAILFFFAVPLVSRSAIDGVLAASPPADAGRLTELLAGLGATRPKGELLALAAGAIVLLTALGGLFHYLRGRWASIASEAIVRAMRDRLLRHLERLPASFHDGADTGDLVQRCTSDVETIRVFLALQVVEIGRAGLLLGMVLPILLHLSVPLTIAAVGLFPFIIAFAVVFFRRIQARFLVADEAEGAMTAVLQENLTGIRVVRAFARQDFECAKFGERNATFRDRTNELIRLLATYWALSDFLCVAQIGITLLFGAWMTLEGRLSVGTLFAFLTYESIIMWPVRHLGRVLTDTGKATVALGRVREILEEPEESEPEEAIVPERLDGGIRVENVTFAFGSEDPVLSGISFSVEPGETLALIGPPGSGKSTIVQLLLRLYDTGTGSIRLDGLDLARLPRRFVRSQIGVVLQEPFLYSRSVSANMRVGRPEASHEEIVESASTACVHHAIEGFEHGYETLVGERGVTLSGGQRQRVALARALLKDPPILVLDDALSAVDTETELRILEALESRSGRRTTIVIAHRLSSIRHADRILVLDRGRIVQAGTHAELSAERGPYARLWEIQGVLEDEIESELTRGS